MFKDLDDTIKQILKDPAVPSSLTVLRTADVSFETPDKNFQAASATVNCFLYEIKENRELRDPTPIIERQGTTFVHKPAPIRVDCSYIVTAWTVGIGGIKVAQEHQLLAETLAWLSSSATIRAILPNQLQGGLANSPYPPPAMVAQMDPNKNAGDFWYALGVPPRPAFYLTVTISLPPLVQEEGPLVTTRTSHVNGDSLVQIGGQVFGLLNNVKQPVAGALVDIVDVGLRTYTNAEGRYTFARVPSGTHTARVSATGFQLLAQPMEVPGTFPEDYDLVLTPL